MSELEKYLTESEIIYITRTYPDIVYSEENIASTIKVLEHFKLLPENISCIITANASILLRDPDETKATLDYISTLTEDLDNVLTENPEIFSFGTDELKEYIKNNYDTYNGDIEKIISEFISK
ncbi:MAG TPA: hypothetical protein DCY94_01200 [Firmicutes bacterium]|nr:hypothetical protein [Bacillota bacterium]